MNTSLQISRQFDSISLEDVRKLYEQMEKERILSKYNFPTKPSSDGYYHLWIKDRNGRRQIKSKNLDNLKEKVISFEKGINGNIRKTFADVFEILLQQKFDYVKDPNKKLSVNNSIKRQRQYYNRYFKDTEFEKLYVDQISKQDIEEICYETLKHLDLRKKAFLEMRGIIKQVLKLSYEQYWIIDNPYLRIDFSKYNDMLIQSTPVSKRVHTDSELDKMIEYLHKYQSKKPQYIPAYALELQILAGLRRGEVPPIEWSDVTDDFIKINKEQLLVNGSNVIVPHTKTYTDRSFPITSEIRDLLARLKRIDETYYHNSIYLFPNSTGVISNQVVYPFYVRMCKNLGINITKDMIKGPHSFRRNGITKFSNSPGGNIMMASVLYGNSPKCASSHYYSGINMDTARSILEGNQR